MKKSPRAIPQVKKGKHALSQVKDLKRAIPQVKKMKRAIAPVKESTQARAQSTVPQRPLADQGVVDTMALQLIGSIARPDLTRLEKLADEGGWSYSEKKSRGSRLPTSNSKATPTLTRIWTRESDRLRVIVKSSAGSEGTVMVEVSVPRMAGLENHFQSAVTALDFMRILDEVTRKLLPWSTHLAQVRSVGCSWLVMDRAYGRFADRRWRLLRLDLARNFKGPVAPVVAAVMGSRIAGIRKDPSIIARPTSKQVTWSGKERRVSVYDKGAEIRGNRNKTFEQKVQAPPIDTLGRVEECFRNIDGVKNLAQKLLKFPAPSAGFETIVMPMPVETKDGKLAVVNVRTDLIRLHAVLFATIASLRSPPVPISTRGMKAMEIGLYAMASDHQLWEQFCAGAPKRTVRKLRPKVMAMRKQMFGVQLDALCYTEAEAAEIAAVLEQVDLRDAAA